MCYPLAIKRFAHKVHAQLESLAAVHVQAWQCEQWGAQSHAAELCPQ